jgi:PII-like signaling protein
MALQGPARRLTIVIGESDRYHHHSLCAEIVQRAQKGGLAGCTVLRGTEGFGAARTLHTAHVLSLSDDLPVMIVVVDTPERIDAFVPEVDELVGDGLITVEDVEVVRYGGRRAGSADGA